MKNLYLLSTFFLMPFVTNAQTTHMVEAGGNPNQGSTPYFDPQFITIEVGDIVEWNNVEGFHGLESTSGPTSFGTASASAPWTYSFTFNIEGFYEYECPVGSHANTQFGTITVVGPQNVSEAKVEVNWNVYPNPATTFTTIALDGYNQTGVLSIYNLTGAVVETQQVQSGTTRVDVGRFSDGIYIIELNINGVLERRKLTIN